MATCAAGADSCLEADVAIDFVDGTLGEAGRAEVERRIDACAICRSAVAEAARGALPGSQGATRVERLGGRAASGEPRTAASPRTVDHGLAAGEAVGRYIVERPLGAGGMGVVSLARDPELKRAVVIKLVRPDALDGEGDDELEARLRREAQAMAQLSHSNVVQIFDIGRHRERVFLAMEFIAGQTLDSWLIEQPRSVAEILAMFRQAGAGLEAAHRAGLLHRDFKPTNVLVDRDGTAKVTDFGLARAFSASRTTQAIAVPRRSGAHAVLTHVDAVVGTPAYMAPEQISGQPLDARTDQYALALTLLDALLGQHPARRAIDPAIDRAAVEPALAKANVPVRARAAITRALHGDPAARFASLDLFLRELAPVRRDRRWLVIAGLAIAAAGLTAWFALHQRARAECIAESSRTWVGARRDRVLASFTARPVPFASWSAEQLVQAIDHVVDELAADEIRRCREGSATVDPCLTARSRMLPATLDALAALPASEDPWPRLHAIADCTPHPDDATAAALRRELGPTTPIVRADLIANRARELDDDRLRADALHLAGRAALALGDVATAEADFRAQDTAGLRIADDQIRARSLLDLLELARWRLEAKSVTILGDELAAILARHRANAEDRLVVASAEAAALFEVGDVNAAFAANDRALEAATSLHSADAILRVRGLRARALATLRFDPETARRELDAALTSPGATNFARAEALLIACELALDRRDGTAALAAYAEAARLDPSRESSLASVACHARARGLTGDVDGALAALDGARDPAPARRMQLAAIRARILVTADRRDDAALVYRVAYDEIRSHDFQLRPVIPYYQALQIAMEHCALEAEHKGTMACDPPAGMLENLHVHAPERVRLYLQRAAAYTTEHPGMQAFPLGKALEILVASHGSALLVAELRWRSAQIDSFSAPAQRWQDAHDARAAFEAAGRDGEVAAIDRWIAEKTVAPEFRYTLAQLARADAGVSIVPDAARPPSPDPWAP